MRDGFQYVKKNKMDDKSTRKKKIIKQKHVFFVCVIYSFYVCVCMCGGVNCHPNSVVRCYETQMYAASLMRIKILLVFFCCSVYFLGVL